MRMKQIVITTGSSLLLLITLSLVYTEVEKAWQLQQQVTTLITLIEESNNGLLQVVQRQQQQERSLTRLENQLANASPAIVAVNDPEQIESTGTATQEEVADSDGRNSGASSADLEPSSNQPRHVAVLFNTQGGLRQLEGLSERNLELFLDALAREIAHQQDQGIEASNIIDQYLDNFQALLDARDAVASSLDEEQLALITGYIVVSFKEFDSRVPPDSRPAIDPKIPDRIQQIAPSMQRLPEKVI